jgi:hypothetical protein
LHARHGVDGFFGEDFSHGAGLVPIPGDCRFDLETPWGIWRPYRTGPCKLGHGPEAGLFSSADFEGRLGIPGGENV